MPFGKSYSVKRTFDLHVAQHIQHMFKISVHDVKVFVLKHIFVVYIRCVSCLKSMVLFLRRAAILLTDVQLLLAKCLICTEQQFCEHQIALPRANQLEEREWC